jgi:pyruvate ferredoxin oxidoreductase gamma subunit
MLSVAAFLEGKWAQAFPSFGSERMGAPVTSYCRIDENPIRSREPIVAPDILVIQDPTLLRDRGLLEGLQPGGYILLKSTRPPEELRLPSSNRCRTVPATEIALHHLGRPLPNGVLLGGLAALTGIVKLESVIAAIKAKFSRGIALNNAAAATEAFEIIANATTESVPC